MLNVINNNGGLESVPIVWAPLGTSLLTSFLGFSSSFLVKIASSEFPTFFFNIMRKIEQQIITAIQNNQDLKVANSQVVTYTDCSDVYLHGNLIARIGETWIELFDGGWQSHTTKSRLNALLQTFGMPGEYVFQKNFQWFVQYNGSPIPFFSGMRLAWFHSSLYHCLTR